VSYLIFKTKCATIPPGIPDDFPLGHRGFTPEFRTGAAQAAQSFPEEGDAEFTGSDVRVGWLNIEGKRDSGSQAL
jgi:hypothetical protein